MSTKKSLFTILSLTLVLMAGAQVSKDSINVLQQKKEVIDLEKQINGQKLKLADLENSMDAKRKDMESAQKNAKEAAEENQQVAENLSRNTSDKKLSREARKKARKANRAVEKAKSKEDSFHDLEKEVENLRADIAKNEANLANLKAGQ